MTINDELLNKLEKLSAIKISPDKREDTKRQLSEIVGFVEVLDELDLTNIDYAKHGQTPFRADVVNLGNLGGGVAVNSANLGENSANSAKNYANLGLNSSGGVKANSSDRVVDCFGDKSPRNDGGVANSTNLRQNDGVAEQNYGGVATNSTNLRQNNSENSANSGLNSNSKVVDCFEQSSRNDGWAANSTNLRQNDGTPANFTNLRQNDNENSVNFSKNLTNNSTKNSLIDDILAHAPKTDGQFFLVPKIIE